METTSRTELRNGVTIAIHVVAESHLVCCCSCTLHNCRPLLNVGLEAGTDVRIGQVFVEFSPFFKVYITFCEEHEIAQTLIGEYCVKKPKFAEFLKNAKQDPRAGIVTTLGNKRSCAATIFVLHSFGFGCTSVHILSMVFVGSPSCVTPWAFHIGGFDIQSYLIMPIQRIPRLKMLLEEMLKHTVDDHADYADLTKGLKMLSSVASTINNSIHDRQNRIKVGLQREKEKPKQQKNMRVALCRCCSVTRNFVVVVSLLG